MRLRILHHGSCFDGASSAGVFARFFRECVAQEPVDVMFTPMDHKEAGPAIPPDLLDGDVNACVDFRYTSDPRLHWWFDHHVSTFQNAADEAHFRADRSGQKFYDPTAKSCTGFLAHTVAQKFGFDISSLQELLHWADIIDGALFESAAQAVELREPALRLMTWIEANRDRALSERFIADVVSRPLDEIAASPYVAEPLVGLLERHHKNVESVRRLARLEQGVVVTDLSQEPIASVNKFIVYYLHPEARYAVTVLSPGKRMKISVGSNPWPPVPRTHDIAELCQRYGGGGHPAVGGISLAKGDVERARQIAAELVAILKS
jgi:hypothetical protein